MNKEALANLTAVWKNGCVVGYVRNEDIEAVVDARIAERTGNALPPLGHCDTWFKESGQRENAPNSFREAVQELVDKARLWRGAMSLTRESASLWEKIVAEPLAKDRAHLGDDK